MRDFVLALLSCVTLNGGGWSGCLSLGGASLQLKSDLVPRGSAFGALRGGGEEERGIVAVRYGIVGDDGNLRIADSRG